jgi:hypothetical protein
VRIPSRALLAALVVYLTLLVSPGTADTPLSAQSAATRQAAPATHATPATQPPPAPPAPNGTFAPENAYAGRDICLLCHDEATGHILEFATFARRSFDGDATCRGLEPLTLACGHAHKATGGDFRICESTGGNVRRAAADAVGAQRVTFRFGHEHGNRTRNGLSREVDVVPDVRCEEPSFLTFRFAGDVQLSRGWGAGPDCDYYTPRLRRDPSPNHPLTFGVRFCAMKSPCIDPKGLP